MTTDGWKSKADDSYLALTAHFIDEDDNLLNLTLNVSYIPESHTALNINRQLKNALKEWIPPFSAPSIEYVFITDNAKNIINAIQATSSWERIPCFNHTLALGKL